MMPWPDWNPKPNQRRTWRELFARLWRGLCGKKESA